MKDGYTRYWPACPSSQKLQKTRQSIAFLCARSGKRSLWNNGTAFGCSAIQSMSTAPRAESRVTDMRMCDILSCSSADCCCSASSPLGFNAAGMKYEAQHVLRYLGTNAVRKGKLLGASGLHAWLARLLIRESTPMCALHLPAAERCNSIDLSCFASHHKRTTTKEKQTKLHNKLELKRSHLSPPLRSALTASIWAITEPISRRTSSSSSRIISSSGSLAIIHMGCRPYGEQSSR